MPEPRPTDSRTGSTGNDNAGDDPARRSSSSRLDVVSEPQAAASRSEAGYLVTVRAQDERPAARWEFGDAWSAMHQFSRMAARDFGQRLGEGASVAVTGQGRDPLAVATATARDERTLRFADPATEDLYRHVNRERQMALNEAHLENRITALAPDERQPPGRSRATATATDPDVEASPRDRPRRSPPAPDPRQRIEAFLDANDPPLTAGASGRRQLDEAVLDRTDAATLRSIADLTGTAGLAGVRAAIDEARKQVEARVEPEAPGLQRRSDPPLEDRFSRDEAVTHTNWWFRDAPDRLAFQERWLSLRTAHHSQAAIVAMVERAQERGWQRLHVDGSTEFRRDVWVFASARGVTVVGYTATRGDREALAREMARTSSARADPPPREREPQPDAPQAEAKQPRAPAIRPGASRAQAATGEAPALDRVAEALLQKAFRDSEVPASLQPKLRAAVARELGRRAARGEPSIPVARVYDVNAARQVTPSRAPTPADRSSRADRDRAR